MASALVQRYTGRGSTEWRHAFHALQVFACIGLALTMIEARGVALAAIAFALTLMVFSLAIALVLGRKTVDELHERNAMIEVSRQSREQVEELFNMTDMLQAAEGYDDAGAVLMATAVRLLPEFSGALYVFNNSRDRLDLVKSWNAGEGFTPANTLMPTNCWALKRGKQHINDAASHSLCCMHHIGTSATLEVPMMARGSVHGLLVLGIEADDTHGEAHGGAHARLTAITRIGRALADSMSLALSNIALQEKLRTQSLRDPLTGLYNRRYMEDALDRYISLAERTGGTTSVVMIDLDHFKRLNDENGHAKGDAVLRDVAAQLVGGLRPSDVVCRYGGEELLVILPGCNLEDARDKAEMLRQRIEGLSDVHGVPISASFGVASVPETATSPADIIPRADTALYAAKAAGRNCVVTADRRAATREDGQPRLAVG